MVNRPDLSTSPLPPFLSPYLLFVSVSPLHSSVSVSLFRFVYETEHFNGVAELLEILGR